MELRKKLLSLTSNNTVAELNQMLNSTHVNISWWGSRLVSVDGYEGSVEINALALKYLSATPFQRDTESSLQDRLTCACLWGRVQQLYTDSEVALTNTLVYKHLVPMKEFRPYCRACAGDPMAIIGGWEFGARKDSLFEFTPAEFKRLWPGAEPQGGSWVMGGGKSSERWIASEEMIEAALRV
ncbi:MAG: hypothetical protein A3D96_03470 [Chlamydiae bacterium RIFCSPHIGHO2_12_FULL_44_59]|nr:MAG: hypothetical protein A2796_02155 [Chlamydiae bacterium RIFCSPHIGHO2_01_FULL_44_39]OGN59825.1 MAG: hypothetical protein A3D96_03470 [Chlamydiae bacterium RIFCSPHIGHO2_12_FULL_44_59]OGN66032.1 MAG: hypothetical protein A2978_03985 [Chlamydiae bacterium RIFCSPLOWO2_01_FULL_44_52]OGN68568.1 MAG: hypothetical protein A3I67_02310 [Chlamydiae bacterium RIFCSPLOWO2_02_FULL_45_22]OGN69680.1 MAG: hypothetical protein A3F79_01185 [Chlamydiae bacterium RIFCSPLOWO2_12_FULL_45_20]